MYRSISDYAVIGDCHTAALISAEGSIDWACLPHFDSPAAFLRILDDDKGGFCSVAPAEPALPSRQYVPDTNILETLWETTNGALCVTDFMPVAPIPKEQRSDDDHGRDVQSAHTIIRLVTCRREPVSVGVEVKATLGYADGTTQISMTLDGRMRAECDSGALWMQLIGRSLLPGKDGRALSVFRLEPGETIALALTWSEKDEQVEPWTIDRVRHTLRETREYWQKWCETFDYDGDYEEFVKRSALALKLMTFEPTGAIVAAPTTSLPEQIGGVRNWDYRFTWVRDATFTLISLMNLGYFAEARDFLLFFKRTLGDHVDFQVLYTIHGDRETPEQELNHLDGYMGSRPVRIGNKAVHQSQLDVFGELIHCVYLYIAHPETKVSPERFRDGFWHVVRVAADTVAKRWTEPDRGIWEHRGEPKPFVYSKGMCWLALDRAIKLAKWCGETTQLPQWMRQRDLLYRDFMDYGFNAEVGAFTQSYGSTAMDAAVLRLPMLGVLDARDPKMKSTIEVIERTLMRNGLVYRYRNNDGLAGRDGAFLACSFWLVDNYILCGRLNDARDLFQHLVSFANDVGLISEEVDVESGTALGNFPQAFTHIALINAAMRLAEARKGRKASAHAVADDSEIYLAEDEAASDDEAA
jgi:GH15 family glucan-1,4-alpha-glucosidase